MNYEKLSVERFQEKLANGEYSSLTGAKRAIGKVGSWTDKQKDAARALSEKHFSGGGKAAKAKPAKKAAALKPAAKPAKKAVAAKKPAVKTKLLPRRSPLAAPQRPSVDMTSLSAVVPPYAMSAAQIAENPMGAVSIADRTISSVNLAFMTARAMKQQDDKLDISDVVETGFSALRKASVLLDNTIDPVVIASPMPKPRTTKEPNGSTAPAAPEQAPAVPDASPAGSAAAAPIDPEHEKLFDQCVEVVHKSRGLAVPTS